MYRVVVSDVLGEVRHQIATALSVLDAEILKAGNGEEVLEALAQHPDAVVVSDVRMPRMDGLELIRELRGSGTPVILHSGYADVDAALVGLRLGAVDFFSSLPFFSKIIYQ